MLTNFWNFDSLFQNYYHNRNKKLIPFPFFFIFILCFFVIFSFRLFFFIFFIFYPSSFVLRKTLSISPLQLRLFFTIFLFNETVFFRKLNTAFSAELVVVFGSIRFELVGFVFELDGCVLEFVDFPFELVGVVIFWGKWVNSVKRVIFG